MARHKVSPILHRLYRRLSTRNVVTTILPFGECTYIQEAAPTTTIGNNAAISFSVAAGSRRNSLMRANVSSLVGREVVRATVVMAHTAQPPATRSIFGYAIATENADWEETTATWNTRNGTDSYHGDVSLNGGTDGGCSVDGQDHDSELLFSIFVAGGTPANTKHSRQIDKKAVQRWIDTGVNPGIVVKAGANTNTMSWHSDDAVTAALRPVLIVQHKESTVITPPSEDLPFAAAVGYGRFTCANHATWQVLHVTNLNSSGTGSLRAAVAATGPRIIVFDLAGTINLDSQINITQPYCIIAGQTAPGDGIVLKNTANNLDAPISWRTHDIIISNITSMPGPGGTSVTGVPRYGDAIDAFGNQGSVAPVWNVYLRNCDGFWSVDEVVDFYKCHDVTIDCCLLAEPLNLSTHSYTGADAAIGHSKFILFSHPACYNGTIYRTVMAHGMDRFPDARMESGYLDMVNCVIYNWGTNLAANGGRSWIVHVNNLFGDFGVNFVGNYFKRGPNYAARNHFHYDFPGETPVLGTTLTAYVSGNTDTVDGAVTITDVDPTETTLTLVGSPVGDAAYGTPLTSDQAYTELITNGRVGNWYYLNASGQRVARSNDASLLIISEVAGGTGSIKNVVGTYPTLDTGTPYTDTDGDGIPDTYKAAHPSHTIADFLWL